MTQPDEAADKPSLCHCDGSWHIAAIPAGNSYYSVDVDEQVKSIISKAQARTRQLEDVEIEHTKELEACIKDTRQRTIRQIRDELNAAIVSRDYTQEVHAYHQRLMDGLRKLSKETTE